jgi:hypothetical protein
VQAEILPLMKRGAGWGNKRASVASLQIAKPWKSALTLHVHTITTPSPAFCSLLSDPSMPRSPIRPALLLACRPWMSIPDFDPLQPQNTAVLARIPSPDSHWSSSCGLAPRSLRMQHIRHATGNCSVTNRAGARAPLYMQLHITRSFGGLVIEGTRYHA